MRGVPLKVIQELMGHVTIEMTERYAHLSPDTRREAVSVLDRPLPLAPACDIRATRIEEAANHPQRRTKKVEAVGIEPANVSPRPCGLSVRGRSATAVFRTIYVWRREYGPADASVGRSAIACAVTLYTSGAATARIAERSLGARSLCMGIGPSRRLR